jgi:EAL domain-containing protein (putative c-di-GMP-specific phosphodiesterase class I)
LKAFIGFAHSLNLEVIAEGIDQPELATLCQKTNIDAYQGYIYAAPMAGTEFEAFLQESSSQVSDHKLFA